MTSCLHRIRDVYKTGNKVLALVRGLNYDVEVVLVFKHSCSLNLPALKQLFAIRLCLFYLSNTKVAIKCKNCLTCDAQDYQEMSRQQSKTMKERL